MQLGESPSLGDSLKRKERRGALMMTIEGAVFVSVHVYEEVS